MTWYPLAPGTGAAGREKATAEKSIATASEPKMVRSLERLRMVFSLFEFLSSA